MSTLPTSGGWGRAAASTSGTSSRGNSGCHLFIFMPALEMGGSRDWWRGGKMSVKRHHYYINNNYFPHVYKWWRNSNFRKGYLWYLWMISVWALGQIHDWSVCSRCWLKSLKFVELTVIIRVSALHCRLQEHTLSLKIRLWQINVVWGKWNAMICDFVMCSYHSRGLSSCKSSVAEQSIRLILKRAETIFSDNQSNNTTFSFIFYCQISLYRQFQVH